MSSQRQDIDAAIVAGALRLLEAGVARPESDLPNVAGRLTLTREFCSSPAPWSELHAYPLQPIGDSP